MNAFFVKESTQRELWWNLLMDLLKQAGKEKKAIAISNYHQQLLRSLMVVSAKITVPCTASVSHSNSSPDFCATILNEVEERPPVVSQHLSLQYSLVEVFSWFLSTQEATFSSMHL